MRRAFIFACILATSACREPARPAPSAAEPVAPSAAASIVPVAPSAAPSSGIEAQHAAARVVALPGGEPGIGFDDLRFDARLGVIVPGGRAGKVFLIDPATLAVRAAGGLSASDTFDGGHDVGATSADTSGDRMLVTDRTARELVVFDTTTLSRIGAAKLAAEPDYVRFVAPGEAWVTEPDAETIETFAIPARGAPTKTGTIAVRGGPESLVVDARRGRAYAHLWAGATVAIDRERRAIAATWPNGCKGSRGIALDEGRGVLLAGCAEGRVTALDVATGRVLGSAPTGPGVDIIAYAPSLHHVYAAASSGTVAILALAPSGALTDLERAPGPKGAHCTATDDAGRAFVCDPQHGAIVVVPDRHPGE